MQRICDIDHKEVDLMTSIVVGFDDTEPSTRALTRAAELAAALGTKLVVISVSPALVGASHGIGPVDPADPPELHREQLDRAAALLEGLGLDASYQVALGDPADAILELAEEERADMIVVGTREPGFVSRLLGTSVSDAIQHRGHCDVLVVH